MEDGCLIFDLLLHVDHHLLLRRYLVNHVLDDFLGLQHFLHVYELLLLVLLFTLRLLRLILVEIETEVQLLRVPEHGGSRLWHGLAVLEETRATSMPHQLHVVPVHEFSARAVAQGSVSMRIDSLDMLVHGGLAEARRAERYRLLHGILQVRVKSANGAQLTALGRLLSLHLQQRQLIRTQLRP